VAAGDERHALTIAQSDHRLHLGHRAGQDDRGRHPPLMDECVALVRYELSRIADDEPGAADADEFADKWGQVLN
jgi:hypothetical protein